LIPTTPANRRDSKKWTLFDPDLLQIKIQTSKKLIAKAGGRFLEISPGSRRIRARRQLNQVVTIGDSPVLCLPAPGTNPPSSQASRNREIQAGSIGAPLWPPDIIFRARLDRLKSSRIFAKERSTWVLVHQFLQPRWSKWLVSPTANIARRSLDRSQARGQSAGGTSLFRVNCKSLRAHSL
jgi:hypothetical protein